jgi:WD40 repeat protein
MTLKHGSDSIDGATVAFSPDGSLLASGSNDSWFGGAVRLWDVKTGKLRTTLETSISAVSSVAFSPDGSLLAAASGGGDIGESVIFWDVKTGKIVAILRGWKDFDDVSSVAFSLDGSLLATGSFSHDGSGGIVKLWAIPTAQEVSTATAVSPDLPSRDNHLG